jgi:hypothetical protein
MFVNSLEDLFMDLDRIPKHPDSFVRIVTNGTIYPVYHICVENISDCFQLPVHTVLDMLDIRGLKLERQIEDMPAWTEWTVIDQKHYMSSTGNLQGLRYLIDLIYIQPAFNGNLNMFVYPKYTRQKDVYAWEITIRNIQRILLCSPEFVLNCLAGDGLTIDEDGPVYPDDPSCKTWIIQ